MSPHLSTSQHPTISPSIVAKSMDLLPDPIVITTPDGLILYSNAAAKDLFQGDGYRQPSSLIKGSMQQWIRATDWNHILYRMRSQRWDLELNLNLNNSPKLVAIALRQITPEMDLCNNSCHSSCNSPKLWLWRIQDLTQQQQQQAKWMARMAELEQSSRHMSEFLANMSHELRTPLTSILGFSSMLKQQIFGELNEKQSIYIRQIHSSGQYLLALIKDILDLSKIEAGQLTLDKTALSTIQLCEEAIESVQQQAQDRQLSIRTQLDPSSDRLWADELRLRQIILNLLSNAIKFSEANGIINVRTIKRDNFFCIEVQDYGIGIAPEKQHLIFKPFQQVDTSIERRRLGTGLGLALTKHLAQLHGGTVNFISEIGVGSCFVVRLPIVEQTIEVEGIPNCLRKAESKLY